MKKLIIVLMIASIFLGCSTVKGWLGIGKDDPVEERVLPPDKSVAKQNPDGSWSFTDEQLGKPKTNWVGWMALLTFLVASGLWARHYIQNKK